MCAQAGALSALAAWYSERAGTRRRYEEGWLPGGLPRQAVRHFTGCKAGVRA